MELYKLKDAADKLVMITGWNRKDVILEIYGTNDRFAMNWDLFLRYYEKIDIFDCDVSEYDGPNLTPE